MSKQALVALSAVVMVVVVIFLIHSTKPIAKEVQNKQRGMDTMEETHRPAGFWGIANQNANGEPYRTRLFVIGIGVIAAMGFALTFIIGRARRNGDAVKAERWASPNRDSAASAET